MEFTDEELQMLRNLLVKHYDKLAQSRESSHIRMFVYPGNDIHKYEYDKYSQKLSVCESVLKKIVNYECDVEKLKR